MGLLPVQWKSAGTSPEIACFCKPIVSPVAFLKTVGAADALLGRSEFGFSGVRAFRMRSACESNAFMMPACSNGLDNPTHMGMLLPLKTQQP
jgi:hypothetical protein